jgi:predicted transglutaminase-like cysteine proteinase
MRMATPFKACGWYSNLLRIAAIAMALAPSNPERAAAGRDFGFVQEPSDPAVAVREQAPPEDLLHTRAIAIPTNRFRDKWAGLVNSLTGAKNHFDVCSGANATCSAATARWLSYLSGIKRQPKEEQIVLVNRYVNRHIRYASDSSAYGAKDYWATPLQSIGGRGDCEDFASAKYFSLISLGFSDDQMRVVIVKDLKLGEIHALMTISIDAQIYVLDNRFERVMQEQDVLSMYRPIYSFNLHQNWMHMPRSG